MEYKNEKTTNRRRYKSRYHSPHNYKTKRSKSENRAAILVGIATFLILASLVLVFTFGDNIYKFLNNSFQSVVNGGNNPEAQKSTIGIATEPASEAMTAATVPSTEAPTEAPTDNAKQSADFNRLATAAGLNSATISGSQMIFVETAGTSATVYTYEKGANGVWTQKFSPMQGYTGESGAAADTVPYDAVTPKGTYNIEFAIGTNPDPGTALSYTEIVDGMRWITDPASINYNRLIDGDATTIDFETSQDLTEYTVSYPYCIIFDYNRNPVDPSKGCSKFLHVGDAPNSRGGIGISESDLYEILMWLNPANNPQISIF